MASLNQNFAIHSLDKFAVQFTITDAESSLNASGNRGWWGVATSANSNSSGIKMQKSNGAWTDNANPPAAVQVQHHGGLTVTSNSISCIASLNNGGGATNTTGSLALMPAQPQASDGSNYPVTYFHECVYSGTGEQGGSTVVTTGTLTVHRSLFTSIGKYRR